MEKRKEAYLSQGDIVRLVEVYSDMLLRIALNRVKSMVAAEDVVQTVFEKLMEKRPRFTSPEHEKAWLIRTAINLCLSDLRAQSRHRQEPLDENLAVSLGEETFEGLSAVQALPVPDRYAVYLYYYEGYAIKEIARMLGEPEGTVAARLSRARKKLKRLLEGGDYGQIQQRL